MHLTSSPSTHPPSLPAWQVAARAVAASAGLHGEPPRAILGPKRGTRFASRARHTAFYLAHVAGGVSVTDVAALFGRSRRAVRHGCARTEDARDAALWDRALAAMEGGFAAQCALCEAWARDAGDRP